MDIWVSQKKLFSKSHSGYAKKCGKTRENKSVQILDNFDNFLLERIANVCSKFWPKLVRMSR